MRVSSWTDYQTKTHLRELIELEYVAFVHGGGGKGIKLLYEVLPGAEPPPIPDPLGARR